MSDASEYRSVRVVAPDDSLIRALAEHRSAREGWRIEPLAGVPEPDALLILDLDDPADQQAGLDALRDGGFAGPVVILGGDSSGSPDDEPIARPIRLGTLLDRLDAHAAQPENAANYVLGPYEFIVSERLLRRRAGDSVVRLTELERRLLACLAEADGAIVARDQLLARVWGYSPGVATHTVETHIWRLRQKMESDDSATGLLQTEGGGYRLASIGMDSGV